MQKESFCSFFEWPLFRPEVALCLANQGYWGSILLCLQVFRIVQPLCCSEPLVSGRLGKSLCLEVIQYVFQQHCPADLNSDIDFEGMDFVAILSVLCEVISHVQAYGSIYISSTQVFIFQRLLSQFGGWCCSQCLRSLAEQYAGESP